MQIRHLLVAGAVAVSLSATGARADDLQNQVLAAAKATRRDGFAFRRTLAIERTGAARKVFVEQFDPRRPAAQQWSLLSVDGRAPTPKETANSLKATRRKVPSYAEIAEWFGAPATRSDGVGGSVVYRFARLPAGTLKIGSHDASPDTQAEALVNTRGKVPYVERVRFASTKGFSMMLVASLKSMVVDGRYRQLADGRVVPAESASAISGSMMGKTGQMKTSATYSDVVPVR